MSFFMSFKPTTLLELIIAGFEESMAGFILESGENNCDLELVCDLDLTELALFAFCGMGGSSDTPLYQELVTSSRQTSYKLWVSCTTPVKFHNFLMPQKKND